MPGNQFNQIFRVTTFGESHGPLIGVVIDGCPSNIKLDLNHIRHELDRRKPGQSKLVTQRKEDDAFEIVSGFFEGKTTGTPLTFLIKNKDYKSKDYNHIKTIYRPSHADFTYQEKYGHRDYRGGGRSSARETASRVVAGAVAKQILSSRNISIHAFVSQVGSIKLNKTYQELDFSLIDSNHVRCPDEDTAKHMEELILQVRKQGDTIGGIIQCVIQGVPIGLGEPVFQKLHANLGQAMLSINAVKGFEYGSGFASAMMRGSEHNDEFYSKEDRVYTKTNHSGGIQGGISNGMDIYCNVAFKPVATIVQEQDTINDQWQQVTTSGKGRHDPCVLPRAVPIVEAMAALVILDNLLLHQATNSL